MAVVVVTEEYMEKRLFKKGLSKTWKKKKNRLIDPMFDDSDCNFCNIELGKDPVLKDLHSDREYIYIYIYIYID